MELLFLGFSNEVTTAMPVLSSACTVHIDRSVRLIVTFCVYLFLSFLELPFSQETEYSSAPSPAPLHLHHDTHQQLTIGGLVRD